MLDIQPYVLRYWQTEFPALASKGAGGRRDYDAEDLETIRRIKELLYDEGFTIASAKKKLVAELEEGGVRGQPLVVTEEPASEVESESENELSTENGLPPEEGQGGDSETEAVGMEAAVTVDELDRPADGADASGAGELGALTRRVERLEGGVASLVSQARQLAAELKPETGVEDD